MEKQPHSSSRSAPEGAVNVPSHGKSVRTALVYAGNLSPAVEQEGFFDFIVPFKNLLK